MVKKVSHPFVRSFVRSFVHSFSYASKYYTGVSILDHPEEPCGLKRSRCNILRSRREFITCLTDLSLFVCVACAKRWLLTMLEVDVGPFELLNVRQVLTLCPKSSH